MMKRVLLLLCVGLIGLNGTTNAESESKEIPTLKSPKVIKRGPIVYPHVALSRNEEGWVELETMVDRNGRPYEIVVVDSVGHPEFRRAAIRSLKRTTFEPGEYLGEKVDGVHRFRVSFEMYSGAPPFFKRFRASFMETVREIETGDREEALSYLEKLRYQTKTLHEDLMYWTASFYFERKWGTPSQQLISVNRAIGYRKIPGNMDRNLFKQLMLSKLKLEIELGHYGESLRTIDVLENLEEIDEESLINLARYRNSIEDLRTADTSFGVPGVLDKDGKWKYVLLRNQFGVNDVEGVINEFQLYCERDLVRFKFEPELKYNLDGTNGTCSLWAIGKPDTEFTLLQL
ncbi:MAG: energy transducer TonB [Gammaproteobacteria bacterium]|nr:energy transducer TonB [Gammaproteobacteria bacterium]